MADDLPPDEIFRGRLADRIDRDLHQRPERPAGRYGGTATVAPAEPAPTLAAASMLATARRFAATDRAPARVIVSEHAREEIGAHIDVIPISRHRSRRIWKKLIKRRRATARPMWRPVAFRLGGFLFVHPAIHAQPGRETRRRATEAIDGMIAGAFLGLPVYAPRATPTPDDA
jgi:hypothetical protein